MAVEQSSDDKVTITRLAVQVFRYPIAHPVVTSFGAMSSRPAVFVRIEDADGAFGWGEIFANWPAAGAEHRARLLMEDIADLVLGRTFERRDALFAELQKKTHIRALQCGEWGPFNHVIAGLDIAFYDLLARKAGLPLYRFLNPDAASRVPTYASGINIADATTLIARCRDEGFDAFKVKVGFDMEIDLARLRAVRAEMGEGEHLFADANQAWDAERALAFTEAAAELGLGWLEEPIPADAPEADWRRVAAGTDIPIAGGENIAGTEAFQTAARSGIYGVIQPDIAKWGGFSGCLPVCRTILDQGRRYCPHFLGGGIGLAASAHLLAAIGGDGLLEVDVNPNPARDAVGPACGRSDRSHMALTDAPGLGITDLPEELARYETLSREATA